MDGCRVLITSSVDAGLPYDAWYVLEIEHDLRRVRECVVVILDTVVGVVGVYDEADGHGLIPLSNEVRVCVQ